VQSPDWPGEWKATARDPDDWSRAFDAGFRIHQEDVLSVSAVSGRRTIRCPACAGKRVAYAFGDRKFIDCPMCNASGQYLEEATAPRVVPDTEQSDYDLFYGIHP
jgi:hypothetical protein